MDYVLMFLPYGMLGLTAMVVLLLAAFGRGGKEIFFVTLSGLYLGLISLWPAVQNAPRVTGALICSDRYSQLFVTIVIAGGTIAAIFSRKYARESQAKEFFGFLLLATLGAAILVSTDHFAMLLLAFKLLSLALCVLVAGTTENAFRIRAALKLFVIAETFSVVVLFWGALIYFKTGTLQISKALADLHALYFIPGLVLLVFEVALAVLYARLLLDRTKRGTLSREWGAIKSAKEG